VDKNINALVEDTLSLCINDFRQGDIKVKIELAKNIPDVVIDDVQIEQVLLNLLRNSIEALQDVKQKTQRHLSVQSHLINVNHMEIRIKDNGIGINEAQKIDTKSVLFYKARWHGHWFVN
jgi:C4-dicarboxylate-specific signal transduction histidine kinase